MARAFVRLMANGHMITASNSVDFADQQQPPTDFMANVHTKEILTRPEKVGKMAAIMSVFVRMDKQENTDVLTNAQFTTTCPQTVPWLDRQENAV